MVYYTKCSKCPPPALTHARSLLVKLSTALLIEFCSNSSQIDCRTSFSASMLFGFGWNMWLRSGIIPRHNNPVDSGPESLVATHHCRWIRCSLWQSSLVPHVQWVQMHRPVGKWSQLAEESYAVCNQFLQQSINVKFCVHLGLLWYEVQLLFIPLKQTPAETMTWTWRNWLFEPEGDSYPPHASSWQPKHGCSDCLQEGWELEITVLLSSVSCLWQTSPKFSAALKAFVFHCVRCDLCWDTAKCSQRKIVFFGNCCTEERWMFSSAARPIFRVHLLVPGWSYCEPISSPTFQRFR